MDELKLEFDLGIPLELVGSRVICPGSCDESSDWDYVGLVANLTESASKLIAEGWVTGTSLNGGSDPRVNSDFVSLKRDGINLILADSVTWTEKFMLATRTATKLNLAKKEDRITLFQAILYGK